MSAHQSRAEFLFEQRFISLRIETIEQMSLRGYIKKTKPALWTQTAGAQLIRSIQSQRKPKRKFQRISPVSKKRFEENKIYRIRNPIFLAANPFCMRCNKPASCVHHWAGRRGNFLKEETWRSSCDPCNMFAREHPEAAIAEGWRAEKGIYLA